MRRLIRNAMNKLAAPRNGIAVERLEDRRLLSGVALLRGTVIGTTGSYHNSANTIVRAFDGNVATYFDGATASGEWAGLDLGSTYTINQVGYASRAGWTARMNGGLFQGSNVADFSSDVVNLFSIPSGANPSAAVITAQPIVDAVAFRYVRYLAPPGSYGNVSELQFWGTPANSTMLTPVTGAVLGTQGSYRSAGNTIAHVFDGSLSTFLDAPSGSGDWAGLDLGTATSIAQISFAPRAGYSSRMVGGIFQGSSTSDFSSGVDTLYTVTGLPTAGVLTTVAVSDTTLYRYVRYLAPAGSYGNIAEAEFFTAGDPLAPALRNALAVGETQAAKTLIDIGSSSNYPQYTNPDGTWSWVSATHWTSGFFPGELWQLYNATGNTLYQTEATALTRPLSAGDTQPTDNGFRLYGDFTALLQQEPGNTTDINVLLTAAAAKATTYNDTVGAFKAWRSSTSGNPKANFNVLMDLIIDSPLMFWAARQTGNQTYYNQAVQNAITEQTYLVRPDGSSAQFAYFDSATDRFIDNETYQGYSATGTWSRGEAWGIYGFSECAAETGRADFLATAMKMADWYIAHLPSDGVPYWDFNDPKIPSSYRDTSAAAVAASGLLKLSKLIAATDPTDAARYRAAASKSLASLASPAYLVDPNDPAEGHGVLLHSALNVPTNTGDDASTSCGDKYFLEAINEYLAGDNAGAAAG